MLKRDVLWGNVLVAYVNHSSHVLVMDSKCVTHSPCVYTHSYGAHSDRDYSCSSFLIDGFSSPVSSPLFF